MGVIILRKVQFMHGFRFAGQARLVGRHVNWRDKNTVGRDSLAVFDYDQVTDDQVLRVDSCGDTLSHNDGGGLVRLSLQLLELFLLNVVVSGSDCNDDNYGDKNGDTLDKTAPSVFRDTANEWNDRSNDQNLKNPVFKRLQK